MTTKPMYEQTARTALQKEVDCLVDAVKITLGPQGRNVVLGGRGTPVYITNSGFAVSQRFEGLDASQNLGAQVAAQMAQKMNSAAGDGTTTALVLMQAILREGGKNVAAGANPMLLKKGIDRAAGAAVGALTGQARKIDTIEKAEHVAAVAAGDEEIGELVSRALRQVGLEGVINCVEGKTADSMVEIQSGMQFPKGFLSSAMITDPEKNEAVFNDPFILMVDYKLSDGEELLPILSACAQDGSELVILADDVEGDALALLLANNRQGTLRILALQAPEYGERRRETLKDIAAFTGGTVISQELGMELREATLGDLGRAKQVRAQKDSALISGGGGKEETLHARIRAVEKQIGDSANEYEKTRNRERLARLTGAIAVLHVGAYTEVELQNKKRCVDDALNAVQAAVSEGVVPGGGVAFLNAIPAVRDLLGTGETDEQTGISILLRALEAPLRQIAENAGKSPAVVAAACAGRPTGYGYDAREDLYTDLFEAGITDPLPVARLALELAASAAGTLLTASNVVIEAE